MACGWNEEIQLDAAEASSILAASTETNTLGIFDAGVVQSIKELVMAVPASVQIEMIACLRNLSRGGMGLPFKCGLKPHLP